MQESFPIVTAPARVNFPPKKSDLFCINNASEIIYNGNNLSRYPSDDRFGAMHCDNSNTHQVTREDFSYPDGSWLLKSNLLTIHIAITAFDDFEIFDSRGSAERDVNIDRSRTTGCKLERNQKLSNTNTTAPIQIDMLNNPPNKFSDEYCVYLADWDASCFKTISVDETEKPRYVAAQVAFLASDEAGFINNGRVFY